MNCNVQFIISLPPPQVSSEYVYETEPHFQVEEGLCGAMWHRMEPAVKLKG